MANIEVRVDMRKLEQIMRDLPGSANDVIQKVAQDTEADIKNSFSTSSPSSPGNPPGVDTGALKNSIVAEPDGDAWVVHDGVEYGVWLEYGTEMGDGSTRMAPRPFFLPAVERARQRMPGLLKEVIK